MWMKKENGCICLSWKSNPQLRTWTGAKWIHNKKYLNIFFRFYLEMYYYFSIKSVKICKLPSLSMNKVHSKMLLQFYFNFVKIGEGVNRYTDPYRSILAILHIAKVKEIVHF